MSGEPSRLSCRAAGSTFRPEATLAIFHGRHYSRVEVHTEQPRPLLADQATRPADQLRAVWGPFVGEAGTFEVSGNNTITMHATVAKNPAAMTPGASSVYTYRREGDMLTLTQVRTPAGPTSNPDHDQVDPRRVTRVAPMEVTVMTASRRASLLVVLAHPDDEIFHGGMLMHLSQQGVRVTLVCATNGEAGKPHPSVGAVDDLGALRVEELRLSCHRLGIERPCSWVSTTQRVVSASGTATLRPWRTWTC